MDAVSLPIYTAGMLPCCVKTIRATCVVEREGLEKVCAICHVPLRVRSGAWECLNPAWFPERDTLNARLAG